ncbi:glycosyltransferase [Acuticoccus sp. M5D2P5]|uniref:glycosyltransferase family protein n=1 Tax=Acuticoccus kalidii TaxID=2910977 RepID=UPI001F4354C6|nr:glycosyltransferase [Acuticoccus kalidii]MCF3932309.1 glycosyltransferase [Acuticoccus kalidii]
MRAVIWVQHLLGTGHTVRAAALAHALRDAGAEVTLVLGARAPATLDLSGIRTAALDPVAATDASFRTILAEDGTPYAEIQERRRAHFLSIVREANPDILLTETFPFGRRAFAGEILPVLEAMPAKTVVASSVRDVLVRKSAAKEAAMTGLARAWYDLILVHADPAFVRLDDSFAAAGEVADLLRYTGFVHRPAPSAPPTGPVSEGDLDGAGEVVVSAGGGGVGGTLVEAAIGAARRDEAVRWRILVSPKMGAKLAAWRDRAPRNAIVEANRPDFGALLERSSLSVSQAGYNTVLDVMAAGTRAIFVPFAADEETEQTDRANALARRGLARVLPEATLTAEGLAAAVTAALAEPRPGRHAVDTEGARRSAEMLIAARR